MQSAESNGHQPMGALSSCAKRHKREDKNTAVSGGVFVLNHQF